MKQSIQLLILSLLLCGSVSPGRAAETGGKPSTAPAAPDAESATAEVVRSRLVKYGERDVIPVRAKLRYRRALDQPFRLVSHRPSDPTAWELCVQDA